MQTIRDHYPDLERATSGFLIDQHHGLSPFGRAFAESVHRIDIMRTHSSPERSEEFQIGDVFRKIHQIQKLYMIKRVDGFKTLYDVKGLQVGETVIDLESVLRKEEGQGDWQKYPLRIQIGVELPPSQHGAPGSRVDIWFVEDYRDETWGFLYVGFDGETVYKVERPEITDFNSEGEREVLFLVEKLLDTLLLPHLFSEDIKKRKKSHSVKRATEKLLESVS